MPFVGRAKEIEGIWRSLRRGENVVLAGRYGMGRTSLMRRLAEIHADQAEFAFVDLSDTPGAAYRAVLEAFGPRRAGRARSRRLSFTTARHRVLDALPKGNRPRVVVLDNIAAISRPRLDLVRSLALAERFLIVAIVDASLPERDLELLRARLNAATLVTLGYLRRRESRELFRRLLASHRPGASACDLEGLERALHGYPLGMVSYFETAPGRRDRPGAC